MFLWGFFKLGTDRHVRRHGLAVSMKHVLQEEKQAKTREVVVVCWVTQHLVSGKLMEMVFLFSETLNRSNPVMYPLGVHGLRFLLSHFNYLCLVFVFLPRGVNPCYCQRDHNLLMTVMNSVSVK